MLGRGQFANVLESCQVAERSLRLGVLRLAQSEDWSGAVVGPADRDDVDLLLRPLLCITDDRRSDDCSGPAHRFL